MEKRLPVIEFSILTISQKHSEIVHLLDEPKSERISSALAELMDVLMEIENEYTNKSINAGDLLEGSLLSLPEG